MSRRATGRAGLAAAVLFAAGNALWAFSQPQGGASPEEALAFYEDTSGGIIAGGSIALLSIVVFAFFAAGLREQLRPANRAMADVAFVGGMGIVAAGLAAESINLVGALRVEDGTLTPALAQTVFELSCAFGYHAAGVAIAILLAGIAFSGTLPRWLAALLVLYGLALLTPLSWWLIGPALLLVAGYSIRLLRGA